RIKDNPGLDSSESFFRVDLEDLVHFLRKIQNHSHIAALPCEARARTSWKDRRTILSAQLGCRNDVICIPRNYQTNRYLPVIGSIGGIHGPSSDIEPHFTLHHTLKFMFKCGSLRSHTSVGRFNLYRL